MQMQLLLFFRLWPSSDSWRASCLNTAGEQRAQQGAGMFTGAHAEEQGTWGDEEECLPVNMPKTSPPTGEINTRKMIK